MYIVLLKKDAYKRIHSYIIHPILEQLEWLRDNMAGLQAPIYKSQAGRPNSKRENRGQGSTIT